MDTPFNILFVDDQWCRPESQSVIIAEYGALLDGDDAYQFHYETAEESSGGYSLRPVIEHIKQIADFKAVILDIMFGSRGDRLGLDILSAIRERYPTLPVFMMTSLDDDIDVLEKAMELGANEYLVKKPTFKELETVLKLYTRPSVSEADNAIWGNSPEIRHVRAVIARVAAGGYASVLITGESGTGKELVARAIHRQGPRRSGKFIDKNCAGEKSSLLDSDLFGHEKGAFTSADRKYIGRIERANGGMLFLDEIGSMPLELQGKLLRVLETREFQRLGGNKNIKSDFQLICATNEDPREMVESGQLREDLFYRINQLEIQVPPLREHKDDVSILAEYFLKRFKATVGASYKGKEFAPGALENLKSLQWPGNIRELKNMVERAVILSRQSLISFVDLGPEDRTSDNRVGTLGLIADSENLPEDRAQWGRYFVLTQLRTIVEALERTGGNSTLAVKHLFPLINSPNATYIKRFVKRLQEAPWGIDIGQDKELGSLIQRIAGTRGKG